MSATNSCTTSNSFSLYPLSYSIFVFHLKTSLSFHLSFSFFFSLSQYALVYTSILQGRTVFTIYPTFIRYVTTVNNDNKKLAVEIESTDEKVAKHQRQLKDKNGGGILHTHPTGCACRGFIGHNCFIYLTPSPYCRTLKSFLYSLLSPPPDSFLLVFTLILNSPYSPFSFSFLFFSSRGVSGSGGGGVSLVSIPIFDGRMFTADTYYTCFLF